MATSRTDKKRRGVPTASSHAVCGLLLLLIPCQPVSQEGHWIALDCNALDAENAEVFQ
jgi:hypothetical protein